MSDNQNEPLFYVESYFGVVGNDETDYNFKEYKNKSKLVVFIYITFIAFLKYMVKSNLIDDKYMVLIIAISLTCVGIYFYVQHKLKQNFIKDMSDNIRTDYKLIIVKFYSSSFFVIDCKKSVFSANKAIDNIPDGYSINYKRKYTYNQIKSITDSTGFYKIYIDNEPIYVDKDKCNDDLVNFIEDLKKSTNRS